MPNFNKLTPFYDDGNIAVELTISFLDEYPTVFKDKDGVIMSMPFPPDVPDGEIDFNDYDFNIIRDGSLIMTGEGLGIDGNSINNNDLLSTYGLIPQKGFDNALLKLAEAKNDVPLKFETRELQLPFIMQADSSIQFYYRYYQLVAFFLQSRYFNLDIGQLSKRFKLCYSDMPSIDKLSLVSSSDNVLASLTITCLDDYPTEEMGLNVFDGQFSTNEFGDLIYSQSDQFDEGLTFDLVDDDLIVRT